MRGGRVHFSVLSAICTGMLATVLLLWGSTSGDPLISAPDATFDITEGRAEQSPATPTPTPTPTPTLTEAGDPPEDGSHSGIDWVLLLQVLIAAVLAGLILRLFRNRAATEQEHFAEPPEELAELVEATSVADRVDSPFGGEPRNAVVACWVALEDGLARAGLAPASSETSLDLTMRVLQCWQVDPQTLSGLAKLYREARFSRHPITPAHRDEAVAALRDIHGTLRRAAERTKEAERAAEPGRTTDVERAAGPG